MTSKNTEVEPKAPPGFDMPFGAAILPDSRVRFSLWAPSAKSVQLCLYDNEEKRLLPLNRDEKSFYSTTVDGAGAGTLYHYLINDELPVPDPASRYQPNDVHGPSMVIDPNDFDWRAQDWQGRPWEESVVYEIHVGTFSQEGTFAAVQDKLDYLKDLGVTAIELMPVADFPGKRGWGYDGVLLFAPESSYGTPDDLKSLIDAAHQKHLMVYLDVVYNHFGPEGNYLHAYAKEFFNDTHHTPWGVSIDFQQIRREQVRRFYVSNAVYWLNEFRFDGLRFDAVHAIHDDSPKNILHEIAEEARSRTPSSRHINLVLENDDNCASLLKRDQHHPRWYHAQWNDDIHHAMHVIATGEDGGYYSDFTGTKSPVQHLARCLTEGFAYQGEPSMHREMKPHGERSDHLPTTAFVSFLQNHDQIGNRAFGDRIGMIADEPVERALSAILLLSPNIPMLFMGEEWRARTPFQYFCDLGPELAPLVTAGRRKEFGKFPEFKDPKKRELIPDPIAMKTFSQSKLDWAELNNDENRKWLEFNKQLLALRKQHIVPLISGGAKADCRVIEHSNGLLFIHWEFPGKNSLYLLANLSGKAENSKESKRLAGTNTIYRSSSVQPIDSSGATVPEWSVLWATGRATNVADKKGEQS